MNCDDCRRLLQSRLDGDAACTDDVEAHLAHCPECRWLHIAADRLRIGLLATPTPVPPLGLADRIVAGVVRDRKSRLLRRRLVFAGAGLMAAAAALLVVLLLPHSAPQEIAKEQPTTPMKESDPPPSLNQNMAEATSAVASLARRTADETMSNGQLFVPSVPLSLPAEELPSPMDAPAKSLDEVGHGVAIGLGPVANSARQAVDRFLHDIPPMTPETKSGL